VHATPEKTDEWPTSTLIRLMRYAAVQESASEALDQFIKRKDGINVCAARFAQGAGKTPTSHLSSKTSI
jgi:hypothetical protein